MAPRGTIRAYYVIVGASLSRLIIFEAFFTHHGFVVIFVNFRFCPFTQYIKVLRSGRLSKCHKQSPWQRVSRSNQSSNLNIFYCLIFFQSTFEQFKINQVIVIYIHYTLWCIINWFFVISTSILFICLIFIAFLLCSSLSTCIKYEFLSLVLIFECLLKICCWIHIFNSHDVIFL